MIRLKKWAGSFNEGEHRYFREDGLELKGVTGILHRRVFPDMYKDVPKYHLDNAADRGHMIHSRVQLYDLSGIGTDMREVANYARLMAENGLVHIDSEYLVSDNEHYASAIDKVYHKIGTPENEVILGDVKTTSKFNREYVSWQLSIYADWFEEMNPGLIVTGLIGIWLREDNYRGSIAKIIPVERKPSEIVSELLLCDIEDREFKIDMMPTYITDNLDRLIWLKRSIDEMTAEKDAITKEILEKMQADQKDKVDTGVMLFTRKAGAVTNRFDTKLFKEEHSDLYEKYVKQSVGNETLQIKLRDSE